MASNYSSKIILLVAVALLAACAPQTAMNDTNASDLMSNISAQTEGLPSGETMVNTTPAVSDKAMDAGFATQITFTEGDLIKLKTLAKDPDNDAVELAFSAPFNNDGVWQTKIGDAGDYPVIITAKDDRGGESTTRILVSIKFANRAPQLNCPEKIEVAEGETITLDCSAKDPDGDETILSFSGWMKGSTYQTTFEDAGTHTVSVVAEDGVLSNKKEITITVGNVNRKPTLVLDKDSYTISELEKVMVKAKTSDPDGDKVAVSYGSPLDAQGSWTPALDEFGEYSVEVSATDGADTVSRAVQITVTKANRAPVIDTSNSPITVKEGELIDLTALVPVTDAEGDAFTVTYEGWMSESEYKATFDDAGEYTVKITAVDTGKHESSATVTIVVQDVNRPPVFIRPA